MDMDGNDSELLAPELMMEATGTTHPSIMKLERLRQEPPRHHPPSVNDGGRAHKRMVIYSEGKEIKFPLFKEEMTIGRSAQADIQVESPYVSRFHAIITTMEDSSVVIRDISSKNGLMVNSEMCSRHTLKDGDLVMLGKLRLQYQVLDATSLTR